MFKDANSHHRYNFFGATLWDYLDTTDPLNQLAEMISLKKSALSTKHTIMVSCIDHSANDRMVNA